MFCSPIPAIPRTRANLKLVNREGIKELMSHKSCVSPWHISEVSIPVDTGAMF